MSVMNEFNNPPLVHLEFTCLFKWWVILSVIDSTTRLSSTSKCLLTTLCTTRFAPRAAYAVRYACLGRKNSVKRTKTHD